MAQFGEHVTYLRLDQASKIENKVHEGVRPDALDRTKEIIIGTETQHVAVKRRTISWEPEWQQRSQVAIMELKGLCNSQYLGYAATEPETE